MARSSTPNISDRKGNAEERKPRIEGLQGMCQETLTPPEGILRPLEADPPKAGPDLPKDRRLRLPLSGRRTTLCWSEGGMERTELLDLVIAYLNERGWGKTIDSGWEDWDLEVYCHPWTVLQICTAQEDHGAGKRLIRIRYRLRLSGMTKAFATTAFLASTIAAFLDPWTLAVSAGVLLIGWIGIWLRGTARAGEAAAVVDGMARQLNLHPVAKTRAVKAAPQPPAGQDGA